MGVIGDLISGVANFGLGQAAGAINWQREKKKMALQQEYDLAQMEQSQQYNERNMQLQNQYQIDAERRANEFNSVGAQVERARAAGVSPAAALGSGGAGGLMSTSSAPSSSTPSPVGAPSGGAPRTDSGSGFDFSSASVEGRQAELAEEQTEYYTQLAYGKKIENEVSEATKSLRIQLIEVGLDKAAAEARMAIFEDSKKGIRFAKDIEERNAAINKAIAEAWSFAASAELSEGENARRSEQQELVLINMTKQIMLTTAQTNTELAKAENIEASTKLLGAQYLLTLSEKELKDVARANSITEGEILATRKALEANRAAFEDAHRLEIHKQNMRNQKFANAQKLMNGLSNVATSVVQVAGAIASGGMSAAVQGVKGIVKPYQSKSSVGSLSSSLSGGMYDDDDLPGFYD